MAGDQNSNSYKIIRSVDASMRAEGFSASVKVKEDSVAMLNGKVSADKLVEQYISRYKNSNV